MGVERRNWVLPIVFVKIFIKIVVIIFGFWIRHIVGVFVYNFCITWNMFNYYSAIWPMVWSMCPELIVIKLANVMWPMNVHFFSFISTACGENSWISILIPMRNPFVHFYFLVSTWPFVRNGKYENSERTANLKWNENVWFSFSSAKHMQFRLQKRKRIFFAMHFVTSKSLLCTWPKYFCFGTLHKQRILRRRSLHILCGMQYI